MDQFDEPTRRPPADPPPDLDPVVVVRAKREEVSALRNTVEWVAVIVGAVLVALIIRNFVIQSYRIPSGSMEETLTKGDRVVVNHLSYRFGDISRGDVVVFERPSSLQGSVTDPDHLIKRVIALPGETIRTENGIVYIDDRVLTEPYLRDGTSTNGIERPITVPEGDVFVLGDNRGDSADGRVFGTIDADSVVGRAFAVIWPIGRWSGL